MERTWQTSRRAIKFGRKTLVMAIINVTPDSFSDGGRFASADDALRQIETAIAEGADIIDIGGESTRPGSLAVDSDEESSRVIPVIEAAAKRFDVPISIDTWKAATARRAIEAGAEIINDISGLRWDDRLAGAAAVSNAGLVLMHLRGTFETMHELKPVENILDEVSEGFRESIASAQNAGVKAENMVLDVGIGFGKTLEQNLGLIANLGVLTSRFPQYPIVVGASRKSFIGKILGGAPPGERLPGSLASAVAAVWNGAKILRVHDVKQTVNAVRVTEAINAERR